VTFALLVNGAMGSSDRIEREIEREGERWGFATGRHRER